MKPYWMDFNNNSRIKWQNLGVHTYEISRNVQKHSFKRHVRISALLCSFYGPHLTAIFTVFLKRIGLSEKKYNFYGNNTFS